MSRRQTGVLNWEDLPESLKVKEALSNGVRFSYAWLNGIAPSLERAKKQGIPKFQRLAPWFIEFFRPHLPPGIVFFSSVLNLFPELDYPDLNDPEEQTAITIVSNWCQTYFRWLKDLHSWEGEKINLFNPELLTDSSPPEEFTNLIIADQRDKTSRSQDTMQHLKAQLVTPSSPKGIRGLAKALYYQCRLSRR
jgi:hypothetical protein